MVGRNLFFNTFFNKSNQLQGEKMPVKNNLKTDIKSIITKLDHVKLEKLTQAELLQIAKLVKVDELKKELKNEIRQEKIDITERLKTFLNQKAKSINTRYIYKKAIGHFFDYTKRNNIHPLVIKAYDVDLYLNFLNTENYSANSKRLYIAAISSFYSSLNRWGDVDFNYFNGAVIPAREVRQKIEVPSDHDIEYIKQEFEEDYKATGRGATNKIRSSKIMSILIEVMEITGIRVGALNTLKFCEDGDFSGFSKGREIHGQVDLELYKKIKKSKMDFSKLKTHTIKDNFFRKIKKIYDKKKYTCHSYRHYFAVKLYTETRDIYLVKEKLGHSTITVTENYLRSLSY